MEKRIRVFKSFEEQEAYHLERMRRSSVRERFQQLYVMQQMTLLLHPPKDPSRKLTVRKRTF